MKKHWTAWAVALVAIPVAHAAITLNLDGTGFVGKGDVQDAFGWNNGQLQQNAGGVTFTYDTSATYDYVCEWTTGPEHNRKTHTVTHATSTGINSAVAYEARKNSQGQITGFNLLGWGVNVEAGEVPEVGGSCQGEGLNDHTGGVITSVEQTSDSAGGLYVHYDGTSVLLQ